MNKASLKQYALYLLRWQLSTPILAAVIHFVRLPTVWRTVVANLIGGLIFYWVDRIIFGRRHKDGII